MGLANLFEELLKKLNRTIQFYVGNCPEYGFISCITLQHCMRPQIAEHVSVCACLFCFCSHFFPWQARRHALRTRTHTHTQRGEGRATTRKKRDWMNRFPRPRAGEMEGGSSGRPSQASRMFQILSEIQCKSGWKQSFSSILLHARTKWWTLQNIGKKKRWT